MNDWSTLKKLIYLKASVLGSGGSSANIIIPTQTIPIIEDEWSYSVPTYNLDAFVEDANVSVTIDNSTFVGTVNGYYEDGELILLYVTDEDEIWGVAYYFGTETMLVNYDGSDDPPESITVTAVVAE